MLKPTPEQVKNYLIEKINQNPNLLETLELLVHEFENIPLRITEFSENAALLGWFFTSETALSNMKMAYDQGQEILDKYMISEIEMNYQLMKQSLLKKHEHRSHILLTAFKLHEEHNWIACIPLFLSQTEGIFSENVGTLLFSEHEARREKLAEMFPEQLDKFIPYFYAPFKTKNQFSAGISAASQNKKKNGPNRNGILHGSRKHLDYGTEINSYKCISLLAFVSFVFTELSET